MTNALPPLTKDLIEAFTASAVLWLARLLGVLFSPRAAHRKRLLTRLVQVGERWVEHILFIAAAQRLGPPKRRRILSRIVERPGFRIAVGTNRLLWKSARIRLRNASLVDRVARLLEALASPARYVARYLKRLAHGLCFRRLVAFAPPAASSPHNPPREAAFADSS